MNLKLMQNDKFVNFFSVVIYLFPLSIIVGNFFSNFIVSISSFFFLMYSIIKKENLNDKFFKFFIIFWIIITIRSLFSSEILFSFKSSFFFIRYGLFCLLIKFLIINNKNFLKNFFKINSILLIFISIDALIQFYFGKNLFGNLSSQIENNRISGVFGKELILGSFVTKLAFLLFAINSIYKKNYYNFFLITFFYVVIFVTGERASFLLYTIGIFYSFIFIKDKKKFLFFVVLSIIIIGTIIINKSSVKKRMILQTYDQLYYKKKIDNNVDKKLFLFSEGHQILIFNSLNMFYQNPIIGIGTNLYRFECEKEKYFISGKGYSNFSSETNLVHHCNTHPHNYYVQILSETGIMGAFFIFYALIKFINFSIKNLYNQIKKKEYINQYKIFISSAIIINLWPFITTGNFFGSAAANLFWLPVGFFLASIKNFKK
jgi:O-antigen ligase